LRWNGPAFNPDEIVRKTLLDIALNHRWYDPIRAVFARLKRRSAPDHDKRIFCSEYVLERLAIGRVLADEYDELQNQKKYYLPAHFAADPRFDQYDMEYSRLTEIPGARLLRRRNLF
jgi:hypothetical protein